MLKIAYFLKMYPRFSETFIVNEILELEKQGVDVRIYSLRKPDDGRFHAKLAQVKANVVYVPQYPEYEAERIRDAHQMLHQRIPDNYEALRDYTKKRAQPYTTKRFLQAGYVAAHLLAQPVDAIHAHFASSATSIAHLVHQLIGTPYSFTAHAKDIYHEDVSPYSLKRKMKAARFVVTVNKYNQAHLQTLMGDDHADIRCLYNGIDLNHFQPPDPTIRQSNLILGVGRLVEKKGFADLIRACAILHDWGLDFQCQIIGKGEMRESLNALIGEFRLAHRVKLVGAQPQDVVRQAMQESTLLALPCIVGSDGNRDALPTVILEAMATGLPVVSTTVTGIPEMIANDENGLLVEPGDVEGLARALAVLLEHPEKRRQMGVKAWERTKSLFDVCQNVAQLHDWLGDDVGTATPLINSGASESNLLEQIEDDISEMLAQIKPAGMEIAGILPSA
jgi:glycosyltransferase involved in cell wall biosynthesis